VKDAQVWLAAIVDSSDDAIIGKRLDGTIVSWNAGAEHTFGYTAGEMIGESVLKLFPPDRYDEEKVIIAQLARGRRVAHFETVRIRKDGTPIDVSLSTSPIRDASGTIIGAAKIARDITEKKRSERQLAQLNEQLKAQTLELERANAHLTAVADLAKEAQREAERANRVKGDFLASMSHELRTPLNAISGYADLMEAGVAGDLPEDYRRYVEKIQKSQRHLQELISRVLDFAKLEAGKLTVGVSAIPVASLFSRLEPMVAPQARTKRQNLQLLPAPPNVQVLADTDRAIQILLNLLSNAIKFTPPGGSIVVEAVPNAGPHVEIRVSDTGPGIASHDLDRVFEPFVQLDSTLTRNHEGTGLGLAISRDLARAMNGDLTAHSEPGKGATFTLRLPRPKDGPAATATASS
jgi:PAS domain S-box-containing protein